jgi:hypothetical protein
VSRVTLGQSLCARCRTIDMKAVANIPPEEVGPGCCRIHDLGPTSENYSSYVLCKVFLQIVSMSRHKRQDNILDALLNKQSFTLGIPHISSRMAEYRSFALMLQRGKPGCIEFAFEYDLILRVTERSMSQPHGILIRCRSTPYERNSPPKA